MCTGSSHYLSCETLLTGPTLKCSYICGKAAGIVRVATLHKSVKLQMLSPPRTRPTHKASLVFKLIVHMFFPPPSCLATKTSHVNLHHNNLACRTARNAGCTTARIFEGPPHEKHVAQYSWCPHGFLARSVACVWGGGEIFEFGGNTWFSGGPWRRPRTTEIQGGVEADVSCSPLAATTMQVAVAWCTTLPVKLVSSDERTRIQRTALWVLGLTVVRVASA